MNEFKCLICNQTFKSKQQRCYHIKKTHPNLTSLKFFIIHNFDAISNIECKKEFKILILKECFERNLIIPLKSSFRDIQKQFNRFKQCFEVNNLKLSEKDIIYFFDTIIPWHKTHIKIWNCKEYYDLVFPNDTEKALEAYNKLSKASNPWTNAKGKYSMFSPNYYNYNNDPNYKESELYKQNVEKITEAVKNGNPASNKIEYWLNLGYDKKTAKKKLKERQNTFTLEKCIKKYGEEEGTKIYQERQLKWQETLNNKSIEEIIEINKKKAAPSISSFEKIITEYLNLPRENTQLVLIDKENNNKKFIYDIFNNNKIIEFNGDFWHCNPLIYESTYFHKFKNKIAEEIWEYDKMKIDFAKANGYEVLVIWEKDFNNNEDETLEKCRKFIYG